MVQWLFATIRQMWVDTVIILLGFACGALVRQTPTASCTLKPTLARRKDVLPLISRQWARVLGGPSDAWRTVPLSADYEDFEVVRHPSTRPDVEQRRNAAAALRWFKSRPGCVGFRSRVDEIQHASKCRSSLPRRDASG